ncbi:hypothetical protein HPP05_16895 [Corallococcus exiguus]|uniref:hypothetical protein n=1 Tax=Corallococcus exiguus TaxID=83462 RepID=UPI001494C1D0|nr:hypothetical protein [Corallococcus exiguus]NPC71429.1 hypothetical protein [Corallococcus exiguus]
MSSRASKLRGEIENEGMLQLAPQTHRQEHGSKKTSERSSKTNNRNKSDYHHPQHPPQSPLPIKKHPPAPITTLPANFAHMNNSPLFEDHLKLLQRYEEQLQRLGDDYSVPIIAQQPQGLPRIVGTGWFFRCEQEWFLITAGHVMSDFFPSKWKELELPPHSFCLIPDINDKFISITGRHLSSEPYDVAIIHIVDPTEIRKRWKPVTVLDLASDRAEGAHPWYHVSGWPIEYSKRMDGGLGADKFRFNAQAEPCPDLIDPKHEIAFPLHRNEFGTINGELSRHPALQGISGAPVWRIFDADGVYRPRLAGVEVAYIDKHTTWFIKATKWGAVRMLIETAVPGLLRSAQKLAGL